MLLSVLGFPCDSLSGGLLCWMELIASLMIYQDCLECCWCWCGWYKMCKM